VNALADEKSPYLIQHRDNPVDWRPWGEAAFAEARRRNVPVFLSIGYSTCHWCHVMAHESFENPEIARLMNENFVNVKVDREERPDVDRVYMAFVQASTGSGGWPMSVWLTPEGKPFFGGTYFPPEDRYGRAGFPNVLVQLARVWRDDPGRVEREAVRVVEALRDAARSPAGANGIPDARVLDAAAGQFASRFDPVEGGFGGAPKFPRPSVLNFLLRCGGQEAREMTTFTLRRMAAGGMRDHLGGGFHRYSVDGRWHVPHFEKMLYDQAQLAVSFVEAWQVTRDDCFAVVARETLDYVLRDLTHPEGGFYSAEDADSLVAHGRSEHVEGAFYVWTKEEILDVLGPEDGGAFCHHFGVEPGGNVPPSSDPHGELRGKNVLYRHVAGDVPGAKEQMLARRSRRPRPHLDDKVLAAWNGLMISAFARAGAAFGQGSYLAAAHRGADFVRAHLTRDGGLLRTWRGEGGNIPGFAEDYAFVIQGLLDLYEAAFDPEALEWAVELQERQDALFWDAAGGYFSSAAGDPLVPVRMKEDYDGAEPSANSVSAKNLLRLGRMLHDEPYEARAREILAASHAVLEGAPTAVPQMLVALDLALAAPAQAVIAGARDSGDVTAWMRDLHLAFSPHRVLLLADGDAFPASRNPLLRDMKPLDGRASLYECENFSCRTPRMLP